MQFSFYKGEGKRQQEELPMKLPVSRRRQLLKPEKYIADKGLKDACNVALLLGQPLLLTGEPGTGKTQFAASLAWELGLPSPLKFEVKSTSTAQDLFYTYDALKRFQDIQSGAESGLLRYIDYQALGLAILKTRSLEEIKQFIASASILQEFKDHVKCRSVVLIDEIDKAPRDFPNDLLNELESLYFRIPELRNIKVEADEKLQPIVVITSNSEKDLPEAFLRRCIYYNIPFPEKNRLREIIVSHLDLNTEDKFLQEAMDLFYTLRLPQSGLRKKPATAELLGWLLIVQGLRENEGGEDFFTPADIIKRTLSSLIKTTEDQEKAGKIVEQWLQQRK